MRQISLFSEYPLSGSVELPASKSISNRLLILDALSQGGIQIENLSTAEDTQYLRKLIKKWKTTDILDCGHGGTTFRFLTAYLALKGYEGILTGSERMQNRPIRPLVKALRECGASINYLNKEGFPPLKFSPTKMYSPEKPIEIDASVSSQFITALLLIACQLPHGIKLKLKNTVVSAPYIQLTLSILEHCGVKTVTENNTITVYNSTIRSTEFTVESDWSSAAYFIGLVSAIPDSQVRLKYLSKDSLQADKEILKLEEYFNFEYRCEKDDLIISHIRRSSSKEVLNVNLLSSPDLIQTIVIMACLHRKKVNIKGIQTLYDKETNRVKALIESLQPCKVDFSVSNNKNEFFINATEFKLPDDISFPTYQDHRMAMALSLLSSEKKITIQDPEVVKKSFPEYWNKIKNIGITIY